MDTTVRAPWRAPRYRTFDFWIGEWELDWPAEQTGGKKGERAAGKNTITKTLGTCVIQEQFSNPTSGGWSDVLVNLVFPSEDERVVVMPCEIQFVHSKMMLIRQKMGARPPALAGAMVAAAMQACFGKGGEDADAH